MIPALSVNDEGKSFIRLTSYLPFDATTSEKIFCTKLSCVGDELQQNSFKQKTKQTF
jgi:hypothetical protein